MKHFVHILIFLLSNFLYCNLSEAANILAFFPVASISHQVIFRPLTQKLARLGHKVVVITTDPAFPKGQTPENLTEIDVHDDSYKMWNQNDAVKEDKSSFYSQYELIFDLHMRTFDVQVQNHEVRKILLGNNTHFDLLLLEACVRPALSLTHLYQVPTLQMSSFGTVMGNYESIGAPIHPTIYSSIMHQRVYNLNLWEQLMELKNHFSFNALLERHTIPEYNMLRRRLPVEIPTYNILKNNIDMLFLNVHPSWEGNQPVPQSIVHMSGIHQQVQKPMLEDLQKYLDESQNGVIYFSFGSNILPSQLPREKVQIFVKVLSELPYKVLIKWDTEELPGRTENIKIAKWFPQIDVLKHAKVKLFITQAGLQSTEESIAAGVPLLGIPMMLDQWYNAEKYEHYKIGVKVDLISLTEDKFRDAIITVIEDQSYRKNIAKLHALMADQPQSPLQRVVWWTEHVLRHRGARHLRSPAANMCWTDYYEVELMSYVLLAFVSSLIVLVTIVYNGIKLVFKF